MYRQAKSNRVGNFLESWYAEVEHQEAYEHLHHEETDKDPSDNLFLLSIENRCGET